VPHIRSRLLFKVGDPPGGGEGRVLPEPPESPEPGARSLLVPLGPAEGGNIPDPNPNPNPKAGKDFFGFFFVCFFPPILIFLGPPGPPRGGGLLRYPLGGSRPDPRILNRSLNPANTLFSRNPQNPRVLEKNADHHFYKVSQKISCPEIVSTFQLCR